MLSDNEIVDLIYKITYEYLSAVNYFTLRQHCLEQKALSVVVDEIQLFVNQKVQDKKQENYSKYSAEACARQHQQDLNEERFDLQEAQKDEIQRSELHVERSRLLEKQPPPQQIINNQNEYTVVQSLTQRQHEINNILNSVLPERRQTREERANERAMRKQARLENGPLKQQLSTKEFLSFHQQNWKQNKRVEAEGCQIIKKVNELCFQQYITCLIKYLADKNNIKDGRLLSFNQIQALQLIAGYIEESLKITSEENSNLSAIDKIYKTKCELGGQQINNENTLASLRRTNSVLESQNIRLATENKQLTQAIKERLEQRNKLLQIGGVILLLTLGTTLSTFFMGLTLVFFTPSILLALVTTGLFIASLVYTARNNSDKHLIAQNQLNIQANKEKILSQNKKINTLDNKDLPILIEKISTIKQEIEEIGKKNKELQERKQLCIDKANRVEPNSPRGTSIFYTFNAPPQQQPQNLNDAPLYDSLMPRF